MSAVAKYNIHISEPWFTLIKYGEKIAEGRPNKGLLLELQIGDIIRMFNSDKNLELGEREYFVKVTNKKFYKTFWEMLQTEDLDNVISQKVC